MGNKLFFQTRAIAPALTLTTKQISVRRYSTMEIELISREFIKPSKPTPPHHKIHTLNFIDHIVSRNYAPVLYFYANKTSKEEHDSKTSKLKISLSELLSIYYPLAGRFKDQKSIDCNDEGVSLLITNIKGRISEILDKPNEALLNPLFPDQLQWKDMGSNASIVAVQINRFACGGIAIGACMSHKVGDGATLFNFVNDWATVNRQNDFTLTRPVLEARGSLLFPTNFPDFPEVAFMKQNTVCRRLLFEGSKIESLKAKLSSKVENPSRVEVVTALIYSRAVSALGLDPSTPLRVAANLRRRMVPPLPEKSIGNWVWSFPVPREKGEMELHELVCQMREGLREFCVENVKRFGDFEFVCEFLKLRTSFSRQKEGDVVHSSKKPVPFFFASWCRFPIYKADFGWGEPVWVTTVGCPVKNSVLLMDAKEGNGIEALVNIEEHDLALFERDEELLQYASLA